MAAKKTNVFSNISPDIQWLKERIEEIKQEVESMPYNEIEDRIVSLNGTNGFSEKVAATKETIQKSYREALKEYANLVEVYETLIQKEETKAVARGGAKISASARDFMKK